MLTAIFSFFDLNFSKNVCKQKAPRFLAGLFGSILFKTTIYKYLLPTQTNRRLIYKASVKLAFPLGLPPDTCKSLNAAC